VLCVSSYHPCKHSASLVICRCEATSFVVQRPLLFTQSTWLNRCLCRGQSEGRHVQVAGLCFSGAKVKWDTRTCTGLYGS
jgi:hypothetical protein